MKIFNCVYFCLFVCYFSIFGSLASQNNVDMLKQKYELESCNHCDRHWSTSKPLLLIDYVLEKTDLTLHKYYEDRRELIKVNQGLMLDNEIEFRDSNAYFKVLFWANKTENRLDKLGNIKYDYYKGKKFVNAINGRLPFGLSQYAKYVSVVDQCKIQINDLQVIIPDSVFNNLFFPNFNQKVENIIPSELFYSVKNDCFYFYLYGLRWQHHKGPRDIRKNDTFFTKIIFAKSGYIGQVSLSWGELFGYNFDCGYFIGF